MKEPSQRINRQRPYLAEVVAVEALCSIASSDDRETIRVEFDLSGSGLQYEPGDALGIHASNAPQVKRTQICLSVFSYTSVHIIFCCNGLLLDNAANASVIKDARSSS